MLPHFIPSIASTGFSAEGDISGQGGGAGPTETVSLSGTSSLPSSFFGPFPTYMGSTWNVDTGFSFTTAGNIDRITISSTSAHSTTQWNNTTPSTTYYIRFTNDSTGSSFQVTPNTVSPALGTWGSLASPRYFIRTEYNAEFGGYGQRFIQCKVEIATDSGGSNIIATGYYKAQWEGGA